MSTTKQTIDIYWRFTKPYWKENLLLLVIRPVYLAATYVANIYLAGLALDRLVQGGPFDYWRDFGAVTVGLIICGTLQIAMERWSLSLIWTTQVRTQNDLARYCYDRLVHESAHFHANHFGGSLVTQTNKFISAYERLHDTLYWQVYSLLFYIVVTLVLLTIRLPVFSLILFILTAIYFTAAIIFNSKAHPLNAARATIESAATGQLADTIGNISVVKSFGRERHEKSRYESNLRSIFDSNDRLRKYVVRKDSFLGVPLTTGTVLAVVFSILAYQRGIAPVSTLLLASTLSRDLLMRSREFNNSVLRNVARSFGDARDMTQILSSPLELIDDQKARDLAFKKGSVVFKNVSFRYHDQTGEHLFDNLTLDIKPGEKVGLVGPSGGGKTTITKLLLRFMDVQAGEILIDGQNIAAARQQSVRQHIAYVPQEPLLFHRSLAENIRYGNPKVSDQAVLAAAKRAFAHEFIEELASGYETMVGERGVKLSGGQRQRVAIARAMLKDAPILVLDEATSALDSESEVLIQQALWKLMEGRTTVVIAHRLSTIQRMDRIIVLDKGKIIEEGSHKQLVKKKTGLYARLWKHQSGGFLEEQG